MGLGLGLGLGFGLGFGLGWGCLGRLDAQRDLETFRLWTSDARWPAASLLAAAW